MDDIKPLAHLKQIEYNNTYSDKVSIVIGLDHPHLLRPLEVLSAGDDDPYAVRTALGWTVNGPVKAIENNKTAVSNFINALEINDDTLSSDVQKLWEMEDYELINSEKRSMSVNDQKVMNHWNDNVEFRDGHYILPIPFKEEDQRFPNNIKGIDERMSSLRRKLLKDDGLRLRYDREIKDFLRDGHAELVPANEINGMPGRTWLLPIFDVKNPFKPEKFRLIHDAKWEFRGVSLNKMALSGPDLSNSLIGILLRMRQEQITVMADIKSMFFQVKVSENHKDFLRFLWWTDGELNKTPDTYRMCVHLFGGVWSCSAALFALRRTIDDNKTNYDSEVTNALYNDMYIDNLIHSISPTINPKTFVKQSCDLLHHGGWDLRDWSSNSPEVIDWLPEAKKAKGSISLNLEKDNLHVENALGMHWITKEDKLVIRTVSMQKPLTKRGILSM